MSRLFTRTLLPLLASFLWGLTLIAWPAHAAPRTATGVLDAPGAYLGPYMQMHQETPGDTLAAILESRDWINLASRAVRLNYDDQAWWFSTTLPRPADIERNARFLSIDFPLLDEIDVYLLDQHNTVLATFSAGDNKPFVERPLASPHFLFPLSFAPEGDTRLLIRVKTSSLFYFTPQVFSEIEARKDAGFLLLGLGRAQFLEALFFGIMIAMILYNLFIYKVTRDITYFFYVCYCSVVTLFQASIMGFGYQYLWHDFPGLQQHAFSLFGTLSYATAGLFSMNFLATARWPALHRAFVLIAALWVANAAASLFFPESITTMISNALALPSIALIITFPVLAHQRGDRNGMIFLLAWSFVIIATMFAQLMQAGLVEANSFTTFGGQQIGVAIEALLLSSALSRRMRDLEKSSRQAQEQMLRNARQYTSLLEHRVNERKGEILTMQEQIRLTQQKLIDSEKAASVDTLTRAIVHELSIPKDKILDHTHALQEAIIDLSAFLDDLTRESDDPEVKDLFKNGFRGLNDAMELVYGGFYRVSNLIEQLSVENHFHAHERSLVSLTRVLQDAIDRISREFDAPSLTLDTAGDYEVHGWAVALTEGFYQILKNAVQAAHESKRILPEVRIAMARDEHTIRITITDNGGGIREELRNRIFDPFFTTRPVGDGAGLGLTTTRDIMLRHSGDIQCVSSSADGTVIEVRLPR